MTWVRSLGALLVAAQGSWAQSWVSPVFKGQVVNDPLRLSKVPPLAPLIIYGAGVLGKAVAKQWLIAQGEQPGKVIGITQTEKSHETLSQLGVTPYKNDDIDLESISSHHVLFCAPPVRNPDAALARSEYLGEISKSLRLWDRGNVASRFVFTSSAGVYAEDGGARVDEMSPVSGSARAQLLLDAEQLVLDAKGIVVRLAGLYTDERGAHAAFLSNDPSPFTQNEIAKRGDGLINQIHYEDAASAAIVAGLRGVPGEIYLAADDQPLTREQICIEARRDERYKDSPVPKFGDKGGKGKVCDSSKLHSLGWKPKYATFSSCMEYQELIMKAVEKIDTGSRRLAGARGLFGAAANQRLLQAASTASEDSFLQSWHDGLECWYLGLPMPTQAQLGSCMGALALHVGSRLEAALGRTPSQMAAAAEPGCEWLSEQAPRLQGLPDFPESSSRFELPPIPALLPKLLPSFDHLQQVVSLEQRGLSDLELMAVSDSAWQAARIEAATATTELATTEVLSSESSSTGTHPVAAAGISFAAAFGVTLAAFSAAALHRRRHKQHSPSELCSQ